MFFKNIKKELAIYIKENMKVGHSLEEITTHLLYHGHSMDVVKAAIAIVSKDYEIDDC